MIASITVKLLLVLLAASVLGIVIGACVAYLRSVKQAKVIHAAHAHSVKKLRRDKEEMETALGHTQTALEAERKRTSKSSDKESQLSAQQDAMQVHARLQAQRVNTLEAELREAEEKSIRLARDFASFKANKLREVRMLKVNRDEWLDNEELPVLSKKVELSDDIDMPSSSASRIRVKASRVAQSQPIIAKELDIPSLAESELPDSVEELEFDFAGSEEFDERG